MLLCSPREQIPVVLVATSQEQGEFPEKFWAFDTVEIRPDVIDYYLKRYKQTNNVQNQTGYVVRII